MFQSAARELARKNGFLFLFATWFDFGFDGWNLPVKCSKSLVVCSIFVVIVTRLICLNSFHLEHVYEYSNPFSCLFLCFFNVNASTISLRLNDRICLWSLFIQFRYKHHRESFREMYNNVNCCSVSSLGWCGSFQKLLIIKNIWKFGRSLTASQIKMFQVRPKFRTSNQRPPMNPCLFVVSV